MFLKFQQKKFLASFIPFLTIYFFSLSPIADTPVKGVFNIEIRNNHVESGETTLRVKQGDTVEIRWKPDKEMELHLHGYDLLIQVHPKKLNKITFKAHTAGRFPISIHKTDSQSHGHRNVVYLEVHPE